MLGFDALGRLALGELPGVGTTAHDLTLTAGCDAGASVLKAVAISHAAGALVAATVLTPINRVLALVAATDAGANVLRAIGKLAGAGADTGASVSRAMTKTLAASVDVTASAIKAIGYSVSAAVDVTGTTIKGAAKGLAAGVTAFGQIIVDAMNVISRRVLQDPVDFYMEGLPQYRNEYRTFEQSTAKGREDVAVTRSKRGRLSKDAPTFTTRTDKKGYD